MKNLYLVTFILLVMTSIAPAQDIHYSQFFASPLNLNPAAAGVFYGDYRFSVNYRNQWSITGNPYATQSFAYDMKILKRKLNGNYLGVGFIVNNDQAGDTKFGTTQVNLAVSFNKTLNADENHFISVGFNYGYAQKRVTYNNFTWDNNWDQSTGVYNPNLNPGGGENYNSSFWYSDFSAGLMWHYNPSQLSKYIVGIGMLHVNKPLVDFRANGVQEMDRRYVISTSEYFSMGESSKIYLTPSAIYTWQGPSHELEIGTFMMYIMTDRSRYTKFKGEIDLSFGVFLRTKDAIIPAFRIGYRNLAIGISYDFNTSKFNEASNGNGGYEFSLIYANRITKSHFRRGAPKATRFL